MQEAVGHQVVCVTTWLADQHSVLCGCVSLCVSMCQWNRTTKSTIAGHNMQSQTSSSVGHLHPTLFIQCQRTHFAWFRRLSYRILELRTRNGERANEFWTHELNLCECKELGIFAFVFANVFLWLVPVRLFAAPCVTGAGAIPRREYIEVGTFAQTYGSFLLPASLSPDPQKSRSNQRQLLPDPIDQIHCIDWENQIQSWCKISESSFPLKSIVGVFLFAAFAQTIKVDDLAPNPWLSARELFVGSLCRLSFSPALAPQQLQCH